MTTQSKTKQRGRQSPSMRLLDAVSGLERIHELGPGPFSREILAQALGHKSASGTANSKIGALSHFGLLEVRKGAYSISALGMRLTMPTSDDDRRAALAEAALSPALYTELADDFTGKAIPTLLPNILVHKYGVLPATKEDVARTFRESMEDGGLLRHGVLHREVKSSDTQNAEETHAHGEEEPGSHVFISAKSSLANRSPNENQVYTVPLDSRGRIANVSLPTPIKESDLRRLEAWARLMKDLTDSENNDEPGV